MSMSASQSQAFRAAGGYAPQDSSILLAGLVLTIMLIFIAWAIGSGYRGWVRSDLTQQQLGLLVLKAAFIYCLLTYLLLS
jgi:integrating conjugative element protein (TIGR03758 family)